MGAIFLFAFDVTPKSGKKVDLMIQLRKLDDYDADKNIKQSLAKVMVAVAEASKLTVPYIETATTSHNENLSWL